MRTPDGYYRCDQCGIAGLKTVFPSGGGSDRCGDCWVDGRGADPVTVRGDPPRLSDDEPIRGDRYGPQPTVSHDGVFNLRPPQSEFLPVTAVHFVRVSDVRSVWLMEWSIELVRDEEPNGTRVSAPYFAAWLDRLGIPWTDDLRKAHEAGKGEA